MNIQNSHSAAYLVAPAAAPMTFLYLVGVIFCVLAWAPAALAQSGVKGGPPKPPAAAKQMTIDDVVAMVQAGLSDDIVITKLRQNNHAFDMSADDLIRLKKAKVSDRVLAVMLDPHAEPRQAAAPSAAMTTAAAAPAPAALPAPAESPQATPPAGPAPDEKPKSKAGAFLSGMANAAKKGANRSLSNAGLGGGTPEMTVKLGDGPAMPAADNSPWDPRYGKMTAADLDAFADPATRFDLQYLRLNPGALDQPAVMRYFIALNNCGNKEIERALFNELDYPALAAFYRSRVANILVPLPAIVPALSLYEPDMQPDSNLRFEEPPRLGEYDRQRKAFPLLFRTKPGLEVSGELVLQSRQVLVNGCPAAAKAWPEARSHFPMNYTVALNPSTYREFPLNEDAARKYIDRSGGVRNVYLSIDVTITGSPAKVVHLDGMMPFNAQASRITVMDQPTQQPIGILFDDHTFPPPHATPPPAPQPTQSNIWASADLQYEIRTSVFVHLAADACGWPLMPEQKSNLQTFLDQSQNTSAYYPKYYLGLATAEVRNEITANGRVNFCADAAQRQKFDKDAASIAPRGSLGLPRGR